MAVDDAEGRYAGVGTDVVELEDGTNVIYLRRRMVPAQERIGGRQTFDAAHLPERIDLVAAQALGDAFQFWRICDANEAMNPFDVVAERAGVLRIPSEFVAK